MSTRLDKSPEVLAGEIEEARTRFLDLVDALADTEVLASVGEGRWSPLQYLEHLVRAEEATLWRMFGSVEAARSGRPGPVSPTPELSIEEVVDRTWAPRVDSPPLAVPAWTGSPRYWTLRMRRNRSLVDAFAEHVADAEMDSVAYEHPISGPFTMRQGMEFVRFHIERHHAHVEEAGS